MPLLELKGRDSDKLIAMKKGLNLCMCDKCMSNPEQQIYADDQRQEYLPHYSTDRNDVWEIWDELPSPKSYHVFESGKLEITLDFYDKEGEPTEHYLYSEGTSFADAVSKAWLKWYYNTQWVKR